MSDNNLFSFPGESCGQTGSDTFSSGGFVDLGSADDGDNPFTRVQRIAGMGETVSTKHLADHVEMAVVAVNMSDPAIQRELEYADRFSQGDITAASGLYLLGANQCHIDEEMEKMILSHLDEYAVCVAELEV